MPFDGNEQAIHAVGILRYAREQIAAGRWVQGDYGNRQGKFCALGWVHQASNGSGLEAFEALLALRNAVPERQRVGSLGQTIIDYNDSHTQRGVVRWFDRAIAKLECQQP